MSASPSDIASTGSLTRRPGPSTPSPYCRVASAKSARGLNEKRASTRSARSSGPAEEQHRLHDLHPRRRGHPAKEDVGEHDHADDDDRELVGQAEEQPNQVAGTDHLRDQVERDHSERSDGRRDAHRLLAETCGDDVGKGVPPQVAQRLGDEKHHDRPAHEPAHRVDQAIEPGERHQAGDAEKARRAHVVAGERQPVLQCRDAAARGVEGIGRLRLPRRPHRDAERQRDEGKEEPDGDDVGLPAADHDLSPLRWAS